MRLHHYLTLFTVILFIRRALIFDVCATLEESFEFNLNEVELPDIQAGEDIQVPAIAAFDVQLDDPYYYTAEAASIHSSGISLVWTTPIELHDGNVLLVDFQTQEFVMQTPGEVVVYEESDDRLKGAQYDVGGTVLAVELSLRES